MSPFHLSLSGLSDHSARSTDHDSSCKSSDFDDPNNDKENLPDTTLPKHKSHAHHRRRRRSKKKFSHSCSFMSTSSSPKQSTKHAKKSSKAAKPTEASSGGNGNGKDSSATANQADKTSKEMDSLELTIDSVARNFGTDLASGSDATTGSDDEMQQAEMVNPALILL